MSPLNDALNPSLSLCLTTFCRKKIVFPKPLNPKPFTCTTTLGFADREREVGFLVRTILNRGLTPRQLKEYYTKGVPVNCIHVSRTFPRLSIIDVLLPRLTDTLSSLRMAITYCSIWLSTYFAINLLLSSLFRLIRHSPQVNAGTRKRTLESLRL